ncbi:MAG: TIGR03086 family metal-binding protein [Micromonosporaceae bacterium]
MTDFTDRYATLTDPLAAYDTVVEAVGRLVAAVSPDQLDDRTPCSSWSVRELANHLVETLNRYGALAARGVTPGEQRVYDDPVTAFPAVAATTRAAFAAPGYLDTVAPTPIGPQPGRSVVQHVVSELTVHGWDLAGATGQAVDIPTDIVEAVLRAWQALFADWDRAQMSGNFAPEQPAPANGTALDRLAAYLGRSV